MTKNPASESVKTDRRIKNKSGAVVNATALFVLQIRVEFLMFVYCFDVVATWFLYLKLKNEKEKIANYLHNTENL